MTTKTTISIQHVGPIDSIELVLQRVNVFLGPQATGKSTIAKIISQARWAEKTYLTTGEEPDFYEELIDFHKLGPNYFCKDSKIVYTSPWCEISMTYPDGKRNPQTLYRSIKNTELYHNVKVEYIPAERNFVSSISNIRKYSDSYNSTIGFLNDWYTAKANYQRTRQFNIDLPDLQLSYRYLPNKESDIIKVSDGTQLELHSASSGQQSILPMMLVAEYVMKGIYDTPKIFSPAEQQHIKRLSKETSSVVECLSAVGKKARTKEVEAQLNTLWEAIGYNAGYGSTHLIIEEPEQNLYPSTQRGLVQHLLRYVIDDKQHNHTITLTTHSPYILYALNNCMIAGTVEPATLQRQRPNTVAIAPKEVGLWLLKDGGIISLQDNSSNLLLNDIFNEEFLKNHEEMFGILRLSKGV